MALSGDALQRARRHTGGQRFQETAMQTITPTRVPGLRAALDRSAAAFRDVLRRIHRIPAWQGVCLVMLCASGAMVWVAPGALLAA
jgi:hypothetical protein